jgi:hypothetical protein
MRMMWAVLSWAVILTAAVGSGTEKLGNIRKVFVAGNNEAASAVRKNLESYSCFVLAEKKEEADAVLQFDEQPRLAGPVVSLLVVNKDGETIWSASQEGNPETGGVHAGERLLERFQKAANPSVKYSNWGLGLKRKTCP